MHEELWAGVELKIAHAFYFLREMQRVLDPPERSPSTLVLESTGAIVGNLWHVPFYANVDAFLAIARSIPEIIQCCFGADKSPQMKAWFNALPPDQQARRKQFTAAFEPERVKFRTHPLTNARDISLHRSGVPDVEAKITGLFGVSYISTPVTVAPIAEENRIDPGAPPALQIAAAQRRAPVRPTWSAFTIDGKPLFDECGSYLREAQALLSQSSRDCTNVPRHTRSNSTVLKRHGRR
jgi:hypothetical protein